MYSIYIVEDDDKIRKELSCLLENYGYRCMSCDAFEDVSSDIISSSPDLVLLDINLPKFDGYHVCRELRKRSSVPLIIVTSRDTEADELISMNLGADDFITKPYNTDILLARISSLLARAYGKQNRVFSYGALSFDAARGIAEYSGKTVELTKNEICILSVLMEHAGNIAGRDELVRALWQTDEFIDDNTLSVNVNRLRKKLLDIGLKGYIKTKRGMGYSL